MSRGFPLVRFGQKPSGIWYLEDWSLDGNRRRLSTGIRTEKRRSPPPEVQAMVQEILFPIWRIESAEYHRQKAAAADVALHGAHKSGT
jgi:hypothetical protein